MVMKRAPKCPVELGAECKQHGKDANDGPEDQLAFLEVVDLLGLGVDHLAGCVDDVGLGGSVCDVHWIGFNGGSCLP